MKLQLILDTLKYGELANVYTEEKQNQIITFINLGLTSIYERFPVLEKQVAIQQYPQISLYKLTPEYARFNYASHKIHKYILDTPEEPFTGDVLFITGVFDEHGFAIPLNDENNSHSYYLVGFDTLQIPNANEHETTFITYRAKPKYINPEHFSLDDNVYLPECLLEALTSFVGFKAIQSIGGAENIQLSQAYYERFNQLCTNAITDNVLGNNVSPTNIKPGIRGYV